MDQIKKNLLIKNLLNINKYLPYLNKLISYSCFENKVNFNFEDDKDLNEKDLNILFEYLSNLMEKFEVKKINEKLFVPIFKRKNKRIHSIYDPTKEAIKFELDKDRGICYEIFGIGFLYTLYGIDTNNNKAERKSLKNSKTSFILIDENLDLFLLSCCYLNIFEIFEKNNINIYIKGCKDIDYIKSELSTYFMDSYNPLFFEKIIRKENPNCFIKSNIKDIIEEWEDFRKEIIFNIKTFTINFTLELKNIFGNLESIMQNGKLKDKILYQNEFGKIAKEGKNEAIIIGASPTLDNDKIIREIVRQVKEGSKFVIAVDNAINFCIVNDIKVDLLIILDNRNILNLMIDKYIYKIKKIPVIFPITCSKKLLNKFENPFIFNYPYFSDIPIFIDQILLRSQNFDFQIFDFSKISLKESSNLVEIVNFIKILFSKIPILQISVKNVGAFSYLVAKYLGFNDIKTYGIDFSFEKKKYYYKDAYFFDFYNVRQNYLNTTLGITTKVCIKKGEKYLFEQYLTEWNEIKNKNLILSYKNNFEEHYEDNDLKVHKISNKKIYKDSFVKHYEDNYNCIEKYFTNILSYLYMAENKKEDLQKNLYLFFENIIKQIIY